MKLDPPRHADHAITSGLTLGPSWWVTAQTGPRSRFYVAAAAHRAAPKRASVTNTIAVRPWPKTRIRHGEE
jgi:hypothetical protein